MGERPSRRLLRDLLRSRRRVVAVTVVCALVLGVLVVGGLRLWDRSHRSDVQAAFEVVPRSTLRLGFTDWEQVRDQVGVRETSTPTTAEVERLTDRGFDTDLAAASSIDGSTAALQEYLGFSPTTIQWEAHAQAMSGVAMVAKMPDGFDFDDVREKLDGIGYQEPAKGDGVWKGGIDLVASIDPTLTPELQYIAVLPDRGLIVTSDTEGYAETAAKVARGDAPSLDDLGSARQLADRAGDPAAATLWTRDFVCSDLSMSSADQDAQDQAEALIAAAGETNPLAGFAMVLDADRTLRSVLLFETKDQAKDNLEARAKLAVGEAVGRGGTFADDLELTVSRTEGDAVVLTWKPKQDEGFVLSALNSGPLIFASC